MTPPDAPASRGNRPCVRCTQRKCHSCTVSPTGRRCQSFFMPYCWGGALNGRAGCYCVKSSRIPDEAEEQSKKDALAQQTAIWQYHFGGGRAGLEIVK